MSEEYAFVSVTARYTDFNVPAPPAAWLYECGRCGWVVTVLDARCPNCGARLRWLPPEDVELHDGCGRKCPPEAL